MNNFGVDCTGIVQCVNHSLQVIPLRLHCNCVTVHFVLVALIWKVFNLLVYIYKILKAWWHIQVAALLDCY